MTEEKLLVQSFIQGDEKAFEILFEKYHRRLYGFLYSLLKSTEDAEEIVQDTFVKIWEKRHRFREEYTFESFLFKIAKNSFLNHNRKKINTRIFHEQYDLMFDLKQNTTEDYLLFKETQEIIDSIINEMPPKQREVFILQKVEGLSRKEIAEKLGISVITVDSHLLKANAHLKENLKKYSLLLLLYCLS
ncbi:MAG: RNA polymerase sigma factor [Mangrovibacterium sp.]